MKKQLSLLLVALLVGMPVFSGSRDWLFSSSTEALKKRQAEESKLLQESGKFCNCVRGYASKFLPEASWRNFGIGVGIAAAAGLSIYGAKRYFAHKQNAHEQDVMPEQQEAKKGWFKLPSKKVLASVGGGITAAGIMYKQGWYPDIKTVAEFVKNYGKSAADFVWNHKKAVATGTVVPAGIYFGRNAYLKMSSESASSIDEGSELKENRTQILIDTINCLIENNSDLSFDGLMQIVPDAWKTPGMKRPLNEIIKNYNEYRCAATEMQKAKAKRTLDSEISGLEEYIKQYK